VNTTVLAAKTLSDILFEPPRQLQGSNPMTGNWDQYGAVLFFKPND